MRLVRFRQGGGRPTDVARENLDELLMLTEAALELTNVNRWAQDRVMSESLRKNDTPNITPADLRKKAKKFQYETEVVDAFLQLGAQSFALHGSEALWERPMNTGARGRPKSIDVALFNGNKAEESRIEFGAFSSKKVRDDATKLHEFNTPLWRGQGVEKVSNFLILRKEGGEQVSQGGIREWFNTCTATAADDSTAEMRIEVRVASCQDAFSPKQRTKKSFNLAIFEVLTVE
ncbi:hypothetical protein GCM10028787_26650 [Brachybacterium horti]